MSQPETPQQAAVRDILSGIDATENESPDGWWETTTGADFGKRKLDEVLALLGQATQPQQAALVAERDLAIHEGDVAQESLRQHQVWLQEAQAESLLWSRRAGEDAAQHRKTVEERDALRQDAERYRWLRRQHEGHEPMDFDVEGIPLPIEPTAAAYTVFRPGYDTMLEPVGCIYGELDAAIDAAIAGEQK